jgi:hypothetical protein
MHDLTEVPNGSAVQLNAATSGRSGVPSGPVLYAEVTLGDRVVGRDRGGV